MAKVPLSQLPQVEHNELCCVFASLVLQDDELPITGDKLSAIIQASGNQVDQYLPNMFATALKGQDVAALLTKASSAGPAVGGTGGAA